MRILRSPPRPAFSRSSRRTMRSAAAPLWVLQAVLYCLSLSSLLLGLSSAHAEAEEFPLLFAQPAPRWAWLLGKAASRHDGPRDRVAAADPADRPRRRRDPAARGDGGSSLGRHARARGRRACGRLLGERSGARAPRCDGRLVRDAVRNRPPAARRVRHSVDPRAACPVGGRC